MEKDLRYTTLFEIYQGLLTQKQKQVFSDYYLCDLSLGEIASEEGFSRQSVYDAIKKVKLKLDEYEAKLNVYAKTIEVLGELDGKTDREIYDKVKEILYR